MPTRVIEFFPLSKRDEDCIVRHFEAEEMKKCVDDYLKKEFQKDKSAVKDAGLTEAEAVPILWQSITGIVDRMDARPDQIESQVVDDLASKSTIDVL
ncbi:hypothetical protein G6F51_014185 [Rhizopus arrhizus]|uniref:Uncharacterized protein n=1 Tax=Rhizopus oryzae TaxID=64495 RepID=A0A9P6XNF6_RHIOR|nr:hypothetical protein G6F51_014185 [Rhizopus arrhizus]